MRLLVMDNEVPLADPPPFPGRFAYTRAELIADGAIHAVGIALATGAGAALLAMTASRLATGEYVAAVFYVLSLLTVMSVSCAYNLWPHTPVKWVLRRLDHAAIFLLIAGTYSPFLAKIGDPVLARNLLAIVWAGAAAGMAVKLFLPGRFDRLSIVFYLAIGWSGALVFDQLGQVLTPSTIWLILAGGLVYTTGVIFFVWHRLRFQNALWHAFVVAGAALHMAAVTNTLVLAHI